MSKEFVKEAYKETSLDRYKNDISWINDYLYKYVKLSGKLDEDILYDKDITLEQVLSGEADKIMKRRK